MLKANGVHHHQGGNDGKPKISTEHAHAKNRFPCEVFSSFKKYGLNNGILVSPESGKVIHYPFIIPGSYQGPPCKLVGMFEEDCLMVDFF